MAAFGQSGGGGRRSGSRRPTPLAALVMTTTRRCTGCYLIDVSADGACISGRDLPSQGAEVLVSVEGLEGFGHVVWRDDRKYCVKFNPPLPAGSVQRLSQLVAQARGLSPDMNAALDAWKLGVA